MKHSYWLISLPDFFPIHVNVTTILCMDQSGNSAFGVCSASPNIPKSSPVDFPSQNTFNGYHFLYSYAAILVQTFITCPPLL